MAAMQNMPPGSLIDGHPVHKLFSVAARDDCDHSALTAVLSSIAGSEVLQRVVFSTSASADAYRQSNPDKTAWSLERSPKAVPAPEDAVVQQTPYLVLRAASLLDASAPELRRLLLPMFGQSVVVRSWQDAHAYRQSSPDQGRIYALDGFVDADGAYGGGLRIDTDVARLGGVCFGDGCVQQTDDTSSETTEAAAEKDIVSIQPLPPRVKLAAQHDLTSEYFETYLSAETDPTLSEVWDWALHVPYQYYTMNRQKNSLSGGWRKIQPKAEFWVTIEQDGQKQRPVYYWKEGTDFYHAGYEIVQGTVVRRLLDKINHDFGLEGRNKINSLMLIIDDQGWHHAPPHADGHRTGGFFDISLGYSRDVQLLKPDTPAEWDKVTASHVLASQGTANGSLLRVTPHDNGFRGEDGTTRLPKAKHGVPPDTEQDRQLARVLDSLSQLSDDDLKARLLALTRISIVGRAITSRSDGLQKGEHFRPIDDKAAARVREGGAKWKPYKPLFFRSREELRTGGQSVELEAESEAEEEEEDTGEAAAEDTGVAPVATPTATSNRNATTPVGRSRPKLSKGQMQAREADPTIISYNKRLAQERGVTLGDLVQVVEANSDRALAARIVGRTLDGENFEGLQGVTWERRGDKGNVLIVDGVEALAYAGYGSTMGTQSANSADAQREQRENTLRIESAAYGALLRKRGSLAQMRLDMRTVVDKEEQRGAAIVFALVFLLEQMHDALGTDDYELVDSHAPNSANEYSEFGWHIDDHAAQEGGPELEYTVVFQCSEGTASMRVAGVEEELVYPGQGGSVVFPAWAYHRTGDVQPAQEGGSMWKLAGFFKKKDRVSTTSQSAKSADSDDAEEEDMGEAAKYAVTATTRLHTRAITRLSHSRGRRKKGSNATSPAHKRLKKAAKQKKAAASAAKRKQPDSSEGDEEEEQEQEQEEEPVAWEDTFLQTLGSGEMPTVPLEGAPASVREMVAALKQESDCQAITLLAGTPSWYRAMGVPEAASNSRAAKIVRSLLESDVPPEQRRTLERIYVRHEGGQYPFWALTADGLQSLAAAAKATTIAELNTAWRRQEEGARKTKAHEKAMKELQEQGHVCCPTCALPFVDSSDPQYQLKMQQIAQLTTPGFVMQRCSCRGNHGC